MKKILACIALAVLLLALLAGCGAKKNDVLTAEDAQQIALEDAGLKEKDVDDVHAHVTSHGTEVCFSIHITAGDEEYAYLISATSGEILHRDNDTH